MKNLLLLTWIFAATAVAVEEDPFLWLEEIEGEEALDWARAQNTRSLGILTGDPRFKTLQAEATEILTSNARMPHGSIHGGYVYNFWQNDEHIRGIWRRASLTSFVADDPEWELLLDVDVLAAAEDENWVWSGYNCLGPKYERCLVDLSRGGTDASVYREFSIPDRAFVVDGFVVPQAKSQVDWIDRDALLVSTDWGEGSLTESGYPRIVKLWRRGTRLREAATVHEGLTTDVGVWPDVRRDGDRAYPFIQKRPTFFEIDLMLYLPDGRLRRMPFPTRISLEGVLDDRVITRLRVPWEYNSRTFPQGSLVALKLEDMSAELIFAPSNRQAINNVEIGKSDIYIELLENVAGKIKRLTRGASGWHVADIALPGNGVIEIVSANSSDKDLLVSYESLIDPESLYYVTEDNKSRKIRSLPAFFDASDVVVEQRFATSKDGTSVPYFLMARKDVLKEGNAPTVQYGYGGFLSAQRPYYYNEPERPQHGALAGKMWVSRGGVLVVSNIRGGGEFGPAWHEAALKHNRHKAFEDFFAISEALIADGVTSPEKLGAIGRSNGGLLMGVAFTQRPDLYAAIDCGAPLADMIRYDKLLAGASWVGEYGDPDIPADREYILTYSPYQNMDKDADYPEVLYYTSTKDDRVHPGHARKMGAKMEAYGHPFLYYENIEGGHGGTANQDQLAFRTALEYVYFMRKLMGDKAPEKVSVTD